MPTPPYAQVQIRVNSGAQQTGLVNAAFGAVITLSGVNTTGWFAQRWELYDFPIGFALPSGWTLDASGIYFSTDTTPQVFTVGSSSNTQWGKFSIRLRVNNNPLKLNADGSRNPAYQSSLTDESTILNVYSPKGQEGIGFGESTQGDAMRSWAGTYMRNARIVEGQLGGGGGSTPTGTGLVHVTSGTQDGASYIGTANQVLTTNGGATNTAWATIGGSIGGNIAALTVLAIDGSAGLGLINCGTLEWQRNVTALLTQAAQTTDTATTDITITGQAPWASAATNKSSGNVNIGVAAPVAGGSYGKVNLQANGATGASFVFVPGASCALTADASINQLQIRANASGQSVLIQSFAGNGFLEVDTASVRFNDTSGLASIKFPLASGGTTEMQFAIGVAAAVRHTTQTGDTATTNLTFAAQSAFASASTNVNGGFALIQGGAAKTNGTTGLRGGVRLQVGQDTAETLVEVTETVVGQRVVALCQIGSGISSTQMPTSSGDGVIYIANASTAPSANASGGGILYAQAGALKWRGSGGTVTTLGPA